MQLELCKNDTRLNVVKINSIDKKGLDVLKTISLKLKKEIKEAEREKLAKNGNNIEQLQHWLKYYGNNIYYNVLEKALYLDSVMIDERMLNKIYFDSQNLMMKLSFKPITKNYFYDFLVGYSKEINPIKEFLNIVKIKGKTNTNSVEKLCDSLVLDSTKTKMTNEDLKVYVKKWLVGCIGQWNYSKDINRLMLILIGDNNLGKTHFFKNLLPIQFQSLFANQTDLDEDDKKGKFEKLNSNLLYYFDDMGAFNKKSEDNIRKELDVDFIKYRKVHAITNSKLWRMVCYCGSSNVENIIKDNDKNRRLIPIVIKERNKTLYDSINMIDLWAECLELFENGFDYQLSSIEIERLKEIGKDNSISNDLELAILELFEPIGKTEKIDGRINIKMKPLEIKEALNKYHIAYSGTQKIAETLEKLGFYYISHGHQKTFFLKDLDFENKLDEADKTEKDRFNFIKKVGKK